uniref:Uncharacterized protein n=1 Tax=Arundo donax TaxID=35708 RepID=A0A0A9DT90_ARUDO
MRLLLVFCQTAYQAVSSQTKVSSLPYEFLADPCGNETDQQEQMLI